MVRFSICFHHWNCLSPHYSHQRKQGLSILGFLVPTTPECKNSNLGASDSGALFPCSLTPSWLPLTPWDLRKPWEWGYLHILGFKVTTTSVGFPPPMLGLGTREARGTKGAKVCTYIRFKVTTTSVGPIGERKWGGARERGGVRGARGSEGMLY